MSLPIPLRPEVEEDLATGRDWYEQRRPGLGDDLVAQVGRLLDRVSALPMLYPVVGKNVRAGRTQRFSYMVYYRVRSDHVEVLAILHGSRDPRVWRSRA